MSIIKRFSTFLRSESGAVTVDWVVLTAAACFFSVSLVALIQESATNTATGVGAELLDKGTKSLENK